MITVVLISAGAEWRAVRQYYAAQTMQVTPFGECFKTDLSKNPVWFVQGGWGKVSAAASTQYAIDRWQPDLLVNLGTCGGFQGKIERDEVLLVERTLIYDLIEQMNPDPLSAIRHYAVDLDLSWLAAPYPQPVCRSLLVSADRDICPADIAGLVEHYGARAADWESGAIAWVASRQGVRCLILRGVSDLVGEEGGEAYNGNQGQGIAFFQEGANRVMTGLLANLPGWLDCVNI